MHNIKTNFDKILDKIKPFTQNILNQAGNVTRPGVKPKFSDLEVVALAIYSIVKDMQIADVEMTGQWEAALAKIEKGEMKDSTFRKGTEVYTAQITSE